MRYNLNAIYQVEFLDHVEDGNEPIKCVCYGKLLSVSHKHITLCAWDLPEVSVDIANLNRKIFTIIKSTILSAKELDY